MSDLKISVIIPIYGVESYLRECLDSVLAQSYASIEIILVDDGSKDRSPQICDEYALRDPRIKVIHKPNGGVSDARNCGVESATGDYILFLDGDDYWGQSDGVQRGVEILSEYISNSEPLDLLYFGFKYVTPHRTVEGASIDPKQLNHRTKCEALEYFISTDNLNVTPWSKFIRRELLIDNNITFPVGLLSEDYDWNLSVITHAKAFGAMSIPWYSYRLHSESVSAKLSTKHLFDIWSIIKRWDKKVHEIPCTECERRLYTSHLAFIYGFLLSRLWRVSPKSKGEELKNEMRGYTHLLSAQGSKKTRRVYRMFKVLGFDATALFLAFFIYVRRIFEK